MRGAKRIADSDSGQSSFRKAGGVSVCFMRHCMLGLMAVVHLRRCRTASLFYRATSPSHTLTQSPTAARDQCNAWCIATAGHCHTVMGRRKSLLAALLPATCHSHVACHRRTTFHLSPTIPRLDAASLIRSFTTLYFCSTLFTSVQLHLQAHRSVLSL